jgi:hypothetical protein
VDIDPTKIIGAPLAAGVAGAFVGLKFAPGINWTERLVNVATGSACAGFVAPAAGEAFRLTSPSMLSCLSFFLGMFGMSLAAAMMVGLRDVKIADIIQSWLSKRGRRD